MSTPTPLTDKMRTHIDGCTHWEGDPGTGDWVHEPEIEDLLASHARLETELLNAPHDIDCQYLEHQPDMRMWGTSEFDPWCNCWKSEAYARLGGRLNG